MLKTVPRTGFFYTPLSVQRRCLTLNGFPALGKERVEEKELYNLPTSRPHSDAGGGAGKTTGENLARTNRSARAYRASNLTPPQQSPNATPTHTFYRGRANGDKKRGQRRQEE